MEEVKYKKMQKWINNSKNKHELKFPYDLENFVRSLNGEIQNNENLEAGVYGSIEKISDKKFKISINPLVFSAQERTFTIAHEIGHLILHMGYDIDPKKWENIDSYKDSPYYRFGYSQEEDEADEFARNFLMPESEVQNFIQEMSNRSGQVLVSDVAEKFSVPNKQVLIRVKELGIID